MIPNIRNILLIAIISLSCTANAQIAVNEDLADDDTDDSIGVVLHADPRLALLIKNHRNVQVGYIYSGKGYRVQIYTGNDRIKANQVKVDFIKRYPGIRTYLTYVQPQFRVKVGDFKTRADAEKLFNEANSIYGACMIVPDIVVINNLKDD